jgi:large conductance mechanosensitive channel
MWKDFREFIMRGNVLDLAVGVIIGLAFAAVVTSLVNDVIMPPIGLVLGGVDFSNIAITLRPASGDTPAVAIRIGAFINTLINFLIVSLVIFLLVRWFNSMMKRVSRGKKEEAAETAPTNEQLMLDELRAIRQALEKRP